MNDETCSEIVVSYSAELRCLCGETHWFPVPKDGETGKKQTCSCGVTIWLEADAEGVGWWCEFPAEDLTEWKKTGIVFYDEIALLGSAWRCEDCGHIYEEPFSDEMCECVKAMAAT